MSAISHMDCALKPVLQDGMVATVRWSAVRVVSIKSVLNQVGTVSAVCLEELVRYVTKVSDRM